jgi:epoxide hydrolase-like predicted phosphatase
VAITAVISDFGGVLTSPLLDAFRLFERESGISLESLGAAMAALSERDGTPPLFALETGSITEAAFIDAMSAELTASLGREVRLDRFGERYLGHLTPNTELIEHMRSLRERGYRMAICTNNVREWEPTWRAMLPVDEIFEVVVDSGFVGVRKPDRGIYDITLERLAVPAAETLFVDDLEINCDAAREIGMTAVHFRSTEQAIADIEAALGANS